MKTYLLIPKLEIQNANAMSSCLTIGFPAMTAWLGGVHALQRHMHEAGWNAVNFCKTAIACHTCDVQTYREPKSYKNLIIGTLNPPKPKSSASQELKSASFVEEARCHLNVSLLIEVTGIKGEDLGEFEIAIKDKLYQIKMAGGDIKKFRTPTLYFVDEEDTAETRKLLRKLMPGFIITERRDLLREPACDNKDALDALLEALKVVSTAKKDEADNVLGWTVEKGIPGWLVPVAVGFKDISGAREVASQRDKSYEHHFVEPIITLGEFKMPYRFTNLDEIMWEYHVDSAQGLYVCKN